MITPELAEKVKLRLREKSVRSGECLLWTGGVSASGYGVISINNRSVNTHKASYLAHRGPIPAGYCVMHKCDVRTCINPDHLTLGTKGDNNTDRFRKGRNANRRGENNTQARLTDSQVVEIRELCAAGLSQRQIAERFGISQQHVSQIKTGKNRCREMAQREGVRLRIKESELW